MTKKEFFEAVIAGEIITEEMIVFAEKQLDLLAKPKKPAKAQIENEILLSKVADLLASYKKEDPMIAMDAVEALGLKTTQKATALLGKLVKSGKAGKVTVVTKGKGKVGYYPIEKGE